MPEDFYAHGDPGTVEWRLTRIEKRLDELEHEHIGEKVVELRVQVLEMSRDVRDLRDLVKWMILTGVLLILGLISSLAVGFATHLLGG